MFWFFKLKYLFILSQITSSVKFYPFIFILFIFGHSRQPVGAFQVVLVVKNLPANAGDTRDAASIPGSERSPGEGNGNPLPYSCLGNSMDRGAWGHKKSNKTDHSHTHTHTQHVGLVPRPRIQPLSPTLEARRQALDHQESPHQWCF